MQGHTSPLTYQSHNCGPDKMVVEDEENDQMPHPFYLCVDSVRILVMMLFIAIAKQLASFISFKQKHLEFIQRQRRLVQGLVVVTGIPFLPSPGGAFFHAGFLLKPKAAWGIQHRHCRPTWEEREEPASHVAVAAKGVLLSSHHEPIPKVVPVAKFT